MKNVMLGRKHSAIGIDIGRNSLKMVQFRHKAGSGQPALTAATRLQTPCPNNGHDADEKAAFVKHLKKQLRLRKFGAPRAVIALPASDVDVRPLTLPFDESNVPEKVREETASYLGEQAETSIVDHVLLGEAKSIGERRLEVLAASVPQAKVANTLELLSRAGLTVEAVDIAPLALCRLLHKMNGDADHPVAAVDIGAEATHAVIMHRNELRMARPINIGGDTLTESIRVALETSTEEAEVLKHQHGTGVADQDGLPPAGSSDSQESIKIAHIIHDILRDKLHLLASELQKLFRYFSAQHQGQSVERVFLVGGGGSLKHLDRLLAEELGTQVEVGEPFRQLTGTQADLKNEAEGAFAVAAGLALRDV